jgi:hypothetical protein
MSKNLTKNSGLVVGVVASLIASLFTALPAQAAATNGSEIAIRPVVGTTFGGVVYNEFDLYTQLLPGKTNTDFATGTLMYKIDVTSGFGMDVIAQSSGSDVTATVGATSGSANVVVIPAGTTATSKSFAASVSSNVSYISIKAHSTSNEATSWSSVTLTLTTWIDDVTVGDGLTTGDNVRDADEWYTTQTITLYNAASIPFTAAWTAPTVNDVWATASATITGINFANLGLGKFFLAVSSSEALFSGAKQNSSSAKAGALLATHGGVITSSWQLSSGLTESTTVSFALRYDKSGTAGTYVAGFLVGSVSNYQAPRPGVTTVSFSPTVGDNMSGSGTAFNIRPNATYTIRVFTATNSTSVSKAVSVELGGTGLVTNSKMISVDGGAFLTTYPNAFTVTTADNGYGSFTIATTGFVTGNTITLDANVGAVEATPVTLTVVEPTYHVEADYAYYLTSPGTSVNIGYTVEDQWGVKSSATNQFLKVTRGGSGFNYPTTLSYLAVTAGSATLAFTPAAATATGSATVTVEVVKLSNGAYLNDGNAAVTNVNVSSVANAFDAGLAGSHSASVSYFPSTVSWVTVTGAVVNSGSSVVVTGDSSLYFRAGASLPTTTSGGITVRSDADGDYTFQVAALKAGDFRITLTNGSATTTSLIIVADAASDMGSRITWDTTTIEAGKTRVVTGTLVDANGNPVDTTGVGRTAGDSGTASLVISYTGTAGIVVGTMPSETDADGKFKISVLTAASDTGTMTITAVYMPQGASTGTQQKVTSVHSVTVAPAAAPEVNAVIGSFNGRWAVRVENAKGSVVSVKAGNRWVKFTALNSNYLYSMKSVKGRTIAVSVWVDGELQNSQTITIK